MTRKTKNILLVAGAVFGAAVLLAVLIRSARSYKDNGVSLLHMVWFEIKFLFSFGKFVPSITVDE